MNLKKLIPCVCAVFVLSSVLRDAVAANFSFTGNLANDDDVQLFSFYLASPSTVTLRTWSYAGGTNAAGTVIPSGGFDPVIALFDGGGNLMAQNDDGPGVPFDPNSGTAFDALLTTNLAAGTYTVSLMQYANFAIGPTLADGFYGSGRSGFVDTTGSQRTSFWALDILNTESAALVPEPAPIALLALGLAGLGVTRRLKKQAQPARTLRNRPA
jgi:hypothetical protein